MERFRQHWMASNFIQRIYQNGGTLLENEVYALHYWCWMNDVNGLLNNYIAYYPFVGGGTGSTQSITNFSQNLISSNYLLTPTTGVTGSMCTNFGYQGNATTAWWDTGINHSTVINLINNGLSFYSRSNIISATNGGYVDIGLSNGSIVQFSLITGLNPTNKNDSFDSSVNNTGSQIQATTTVTWGYKSGNRIGNTLSLYHNGGQIATGTGTSDSGINQTILLGTLIAQIGSIYHQSGRQYAMFGVHQGFTAAQEALRWWGDEVIKGLHMIR